MYGIDYTFVYFCRIRICRGDLSTVRYSILDLYCIVSVIGIQQSLFQPRLHKSLVSKQGRSKDHISMRLSTITCSDLTTGK